MDIWEILADQQIASPVKAKIRAAATRAQRKREKELADGDILFRQWQKWHAKRRDELLGGAWGEAARELADFLDRMTIEDAPALLTLVERSALRKADNDARFLALELVAHRIMYVREQLGLAPMDDSLPFSGEPPTCFEIIREMLK